MAVSATLDGFGPFFGGEGNQAAAGRIDQGPLHDRGCALFIQDGYEGFSHFQFGDGFGHIELGVGTEGFRRFTVFWSRA
jgi:hypothetical protein